MTWQMILADLVDVDDSDVHQRGTYRGMAQERYSRVMRAQPHGFASVPPAGSRGAMLLGGANREIAVALGMEHGDYRPRNLPAGATALYDHAGGLLSIVNKNVRLVCGTMTVEASGKVTFNADVVFNGSVGLGGEGGRAVALKDSIDTNGDRIVGNVASKVTAV